MIGRVKNKLLDLINEEGFRLLVIALPTTVKPFLKGSDKVIGYNEYELLND